MMKDAPHPGQPGTQSTGAGWALLIWTSVLAAGALVVVPLWMLPGNSTPDRIAASKPLLPPSAEFATVDGGVHAFFGDYGVQPGDGEPGIPREQAQQQIAAESVGFMDRIQSAG